MKCSICGRTLKNPKSRELGYGPVCYRKKYGAVRHFGHKDDTSAELEPDYNIPGQISIMDYLETLGEK